MRKVPKIIGVDYGRKRVGVAVSDERGVVAFPKAIVPNDSALIPTMVDLIRKEKATMVVIGESRNAEGKENPVMRGARAFADKLERVVAVTIRFEPEFYTSVEARRAPQGHRTRRRGEKSDRKKKEVDAEAATLILNSYIARTKKS